MTSTTPTHRVLATDIRPGDLLIGHAVGGALADLSDCPPRLACGTVSATSGPDTIQCALRKAPVVDLILHGGWCVEMRIDADRYYDVRRASPEKEHTTMTSTTTTAFEIFSRTTGHSFGTWDATTASEAMDQMEAQAGEIDRSDLEALLVVTEADIEREVAEFDLLLVARPRDDKQGWAVDVFDGRRAWTKTHLGEGGAA